MPTISLLRKSKVPSRTIPLQKQVTWMGIVRKVSIVHYKPIPGNVIILD
jgi:hypothetical protein